MSKLAMISQPMGGKSDTEIKETREAAVKKLTDLGYEVLNTLFDFNDDDLKDEGYKNIPVFYLGKSIEKLAMADILFVCEGWETAPGCGIEIAVAKNYNIPVIYDKNALW